MVCALWAAGLEMSGTDDMEAARLRACTLGGIVNSPRRSRCLRPSHGESTVITTALAPAASARSTRDAVTARFRNT
jgi:hypothetical protein